MYFLTNKENVIIAISDDLLEKMGIDDICLVSKAIVNELVKIDEEKSEIKLITESESYSFKSQTMQSILGELKIYNINKPLAKEADIETENIDNLDKKEIIKENKEFSIPDISAMPKDEFKEEELKEATLLDTKNLNSAEALKIEESEMTQLEIKELKIPEIPKEALEEESIKLKDIEEDNLEIVKSDKKISEESSNEIGIKDYTQNEKKKETPVIEKELIDTEKNETLDIKIPLDTKEELAEKDNKKYIKIDEISYDTKEQKGEIEKIIEESQDKLEKESKKSIFSKALFPWTKKKKREKSENKKEAIEEKVEEKENIETPQTIDKGKEEAYNEDRVEENRIELEKNEISNINKENKIETATPIEKESSFDINLEENRVNNIEETPIEEEIIENENKTLLRENDIDKFAKLEEALLEDEKEELKENILSKNIEAKNEDVKKVEKEQDITEKIIKLQIDNIDIEENAKKLNLDVDSYKMLIRSYLDEIASYIPQLSQNEKEIKEMLIDAGQLLSLNSMILKLNKLTDNSENNKAIINEIKNYSKLLKDKINKNKIELSSELEKNITHDNEEVQEQNLIESEKENETIFEENNDKIEESKDNVIVPDIAEDAIDISNPQELYEKIKAENIDLNFEKTAKELNLPTELIKEFISDFYLQTKEHLNILINAYNEENLEKIQTTAHMLKGAANNLRLKKIADNLLKIQKEKEFNTLAELIKKFAAQVKGLELALKSGGE